MIRLEDMVQVKSIKLNMRVAQYNMQLLETMFFTDKIHI